MKMYGFRIQKPEEQLSWTWFGLLSQTRPSENKHIQTPSGHACTRTQVKTCIKTYCKCMIAQKHIAIAQVHTCTKTYRTCTSDVTYIQVWWPILGMCALHLTHPSAHTQQWTHTQNVNTHLEQWAAIYAAVPREQLGVRYLAQVHLVVVLKVHNIHAQKHATIAQVHTCTKI